MHIIIGLITALATLLYIMDRLGLDIGWLNPWAWRRRRAWAKKYEGDPIYSVEDPMQIAAILVVGTVRMAGDLSADKQALLLELFETTFSLDTRNARELYTSAAHLLGSPQVIQTQLENLVERNQSVFTPEQTGSFVQMIEKAVEDPDESLRAFVKDMQNKLGTDVAQGHWG